MFRILKTLKPNFDCFNSSRQYCYKKKKFKNMVIMDTLYNMYFLFGHILVSITSIMRYYKHKCNNFMRSASIPTAAVFFNYVAVNYNAREHGFYILFNSPLMGNARDVSRYLGHDLWVRFYYHNIIMYTRTKEIIICIYKNTHIISVRENRHGRP